MLTGLFPLDYNCSMEPNDTHAHTSDVSNIYCTHWDSVYAEDEGQHEREWHATYDKIKPFTSKFLNKVDELLQRNFSTFCDCDEIAPVDKVEASPDANDGIIVDIGCGGSAIGFDILEEYAGLNKLVLTDISPTIIETLRDSRCNEDDRVSCHVCDVRDMRSCVPTGSAVVVIDKGTLDALHGTDDKIAMLRECKRILARNGCIVSISFPAVARFKLLAEWAPQLNLAWRFKVIADGDPAGGHPAVFCTILYHSDVETSMAEVPDTVDPLTQTCVHRITTAGSLYDAAESDEEVVPVEDLDALAPQR